MGSNGTHLRFQSLRFQPHAVAVGFAGLRAARLAHVGAIPPVPKGTSLRTSKPMASAMRTIISKSALRSGDFAGFLQNLQIAAGVGEGAGLFVSIGGGQNNICDSARFR